MQKALKLPKLSPTTKKFLSLGVIALTIILFVYYLKTHPDSLDPLKEASILTFSSIFLLYCAFLFTNFLVTQKTIQICGKTYPNKQALLLTIYSTIVNFFGPLQSGPGFRAVYLKTKLGIKIADYTKATLLYYVFFAFISLSFLGFAAAPILTIVIAIPALIVIYFLVAKRTSQNLANYVIIFLITIAQILVVSGIYYVCLQTVGNPSIVSTLAYTGAANLALFVSLTPAAIGIREAFLLFTQSIHGIPTDQIVAASLLDRSVYFVFLIVIFAYSSFFHLKNQLLNSSKATETTS